VRGSTESLLVFADDWGRHPSSAQHLARHLLNRHAMYWVNTIGTRTPRLDWASVMRGFEKARHWFRRSSPTSADDANLHVLNPRMWPWFNSTSSRWLNRRLLVRQLAPLLDSLPELPVAVTTIPLVSELIGVLPVRRWVYYCVDDFGQWPGLDQATLQRMERKLVDEADTIVAVSETLQARLARMGRSSHLLTHGVELDFWAQPQDGGLLMLQGVERPLVVFWGVVDRRMDTTFLERLSAAMARGTIVLAGPAADPDPALGRLPRVRQLGSLPFAQLPWLAREAAVLVMPYADLPVTRAIQPLKLKEYLATGKPVVVRDLPATRAWADCLDLANTPEAFAQAVQLRLATGLTPDQEAARARLTGESWTEKARAFEHWVFGGEPSGDLESR
jgi:glycosyltransferase involved in cell wall biosynthesis